MTYDEVRKMARKHTGFCYSCPVCNGVACGNTLPGPGAKGAGKIAIENFNAWQDIYLNLDTIAEDKPIDTQFELFGKSFSYPIFAAPMGAVAEHFLDSLNQAEYDRMLIRGCNQAGIAAFTGDGLDDKYFSDACKMIRDNGFGIPTVKPWAKEKAFTKIDIAKDCGIQVICMDIDGSGLPFYKKANPPSGTKTVEQLKEIITYADMPFILKGIMTPAGARKAKEAGASGIVVSNHGGRVLDQTPATAWVLPEIVDAVGDGMTIFVDGGIRTGLDVFKALALGADAVLIGRPFGTCVYGAGEEGVKVFVNQLGAELTDAMQMCGPRSLSEIKPEHIWMK